MLWMHLNPIPHSTRTFVAFSSKHCNFVWIGLIDAVPCSFRLLLLLELDVNGVAQSPPKTEQTHSRSHETSTTSRPLMFDLCWLKSLSVSLVSINLSIALCNFDQTLFLMDWWILSGIPGLWTVWNFDLNLMVTWTLATTTTHCRRSRRDRRCWTGRGSEQTD